MKHQRAILGSLLVLTVSFIVGLIVWQNNRQEMSGVQWGLVDAYKRDARYLFNGEYGRFIYGPDPPSDTTVIMHPPGYSIFLAGNYFLFGDNESFRVTQVLVCSLIPVFLFLCASRLFDAPAATLAGLTAALSPQLAYYAGVPLPDGLSILPVIIALFFFTLDVQKPALWRAAVCGLCVGLSCWLRSNSLLLPVFFAGSLFLLMSARLAWRHAAVILISFVATISPITIRNYVVFDAFVPVSSAAGHNLIAGLADYDTTGELGLPVYDVDAAKQEAERYGRPDYADSQYTPDGIVRERDRVKRGLAVIAEHPAWFAGVVLRRGLNYSLRFERVPVIAPERDEYATTPRLLYYLNVPLKSIQKLFITAVFLPLIMLGLALLVRAGKYKELAIYLTVPAYYFFVQSLLHTEYRYVLASNAVQLTFASFAMAWLFSKIRGFFSRTATGGPDEAE